MGLSKEDYYNTPNSELGGNNDVIDPAVAGDDVTDPAAPAAPAAKDETPPAPAAKGDLSDEELEKLKTAGAPKAEPSSKEPKKDDAPKQAEDYEIEVDDDSPLTDDDVAEVVKLAEKRGMTKEEAQEEIARRESFIKRGLSANEHKANKVLEDYNKEVSNHPLFATNEIKQESMAAVNEAIDRFFDPSFKERFELYYKRDVHLLTALHRLGKPFVADKMVGNPVGKVPSVDLGEGSDAAEEARLRAMYPEQFAKK